MTMRSVSTVYVLFSSNQYRPTICDGFSIFSETCLGLVLIPFPCLVVVTCLPVLYLFHARENLSIENRIPGTISSTRCSEVRMRTPAIGKQFQVLWFSNRWEWRVWKGCRWTNKSRLVTMEGSIWSYLL